MELLTQICKDFKDNGLKIYNKGQTENIEIDVKQCEQLPLLSAGNSCLTGVEIRLFIKKDDPFVDY